MAETIKDKVADAGQMVAEAAKAVGHTIADGASAAFEFVKGKSGIGTPAENETAGGTHIGVGMDVIASGGQKVGVVEGMEGATIKLTTAAGQTRTIPAKWVERADKRVRLAKSEQEIELV